MILLLVERCRSYDSRRSPYSVIYMNPNSRRATAREHNSVSVGSSFGVRRSSFVGCERMLFAREQKSTIDGRCVCAMLLTAALEMQPGARARASAISFMWSARSLSLSHSLVLSHVRSLCACPKVWGPYAHNDDSALTQTRTHRDDCLPPPPPGFHSRNSCFCQTAKRSSALVMPLSLCVCVCECVFVSERWSSLGMRSFVFVCVCAEASQVDRLPIGAFLGDPAATRLHLHFGPQLIDLDLVAWLD